MHPGPRLTRDRDRAGEVVECAGVDVARLQRDDGGSVSVGERAGETIDVDPSLAVGTHGDGRSEPGHPPREHRGGVDGVAREEADARGGLEALDRDRGRCGG